MRRLGALVPAGHPPIEPGFLDTLGDDRRPEDDR
jgi:hypothetical protein